MTTKLPPEFYLPLWEEAAKEEIGIEIKCEPDDQIRIINALYECRKATGGFADLIITQPKPLGTIFITHKTVAELMP